MKVRGVTINKGMTVNLGGHQFHKVEIGMEAIFDDDDDFEAGVNQLTALVNSKLADEINQVTDKKPTKKLRPEGDISAIASPKQVLMEGQNG